MCKVKKSIFLVLSLFAITLNVKGASCDYEEKAKLNNEIANVKVNYEIKEYLVDPSTYEVPDEVVGTPDEDTFELWLDYFQINILNLTENMYVIVKNDQDKEEIRYNYSDVKDGVINFARYNRENVVKYTFEIYASDVSSCGGNKLKTLTLTLPRYNEYSAYDMCSSVPDYYLCQDYTTSKEVEFGEFVENVLEEIEKRNEEEQKQKEKESKWYYKIGKFVSEHKTAFMIAGGVIVVAGGATTVVVIKRKRRDVIWERKNY